MEITSFLTLPDQRQLNFIQQSRRLIMIAPLKGEGE